MDPILDMAETVRERLSARPGTVQVPTDGLELYAAPNFLDDSECDQLIRMIDAGRRPSGILAEMPDPEFRTSESCDLEQRHPLVKRIEAKLTELMGLPAKNGETIQGQRYAVGQQFKPHHDFFYPSESYWPAQRRSGGQRTWTAMMFLNVPDEGGHTLFPQAKVKIAPRRGNLLTWNNLDAAGAPNQMSLHAGTPVVAGVKYVITKWYRERPWTPQFAHADPSLG